MQVGGETSISVTQDPWLLDDDLGIISTDLDANFDTTRVNNLMHTVKLG